MVPFSAPGVDVRPIKQMSGGANFNEVFLTDVRLSDDLRLGPVGEGWRVALTCLGFERDHSGGGGGGHVGGGFKRVLLTARHLGLTNEPRMRQTLADLYIHHRVAQMTNRRAAAAIKAGQTPGPEASLGKLMWTANMTRVSDAISTRARTRAPGRHRRLGHVRLDRARARRARLPHRGRLGRDPAQHHRRAGPRPALRATRRQGRALRRGPARSPVLPTTLRGAGSRAGRLGYSISPICTPTS